MAFVVTDQKKTAITNGDKIVATFKVLLVGSGGTGKSVFAKRHLTGEFKTKYDATQGCEYTPIPFHTTCGRILLNICDTAGQEHLGSLRDGYYVGAHACILFFDVSARDTYSKIPSWYKDVRRVCDNIPIVLVGNKCDIKDRKVQPKSILFHKRNNLQYYDISAKSNFNIQKPFLYLLQQLTGQKELEFAVQPAVKPPEAPALPPALVAENEKVLAQVMATPLPAHLLADEDL